LDRINVEILDSLILYKYINIRRFKRSEYMIMIKNELIICK
jgi:hypothetical protein